ncbi:Bardet-Biedl syndrome 7 protein homolog isoform X2 [Bombyx mandarina]|uniref:Bardet-Biedl syndrome 7 protein homolog isoform X2 n=2 Tax=Bombyx mandarina TaxID=7092 RepID=A0A6J2JTP4_BOMMA|nr:Bardet-Biedl syndrome 7 protein homolog isoform X2 [Bombyx mandarina]
MLKILCQQSEKDVAGIIIVYYRVMDYDMCRIDYFISGITYPDTLKILPSQGQKLEQKVVVGDKTGVLQCLTIRDEEPVIQFKTLPGKPITAVQLTSTNGTQPDKIFAASGNEVKGYTKKGKVFFSIETALSEPVTSMCVFGGDLILCSGRTITFYRDSKEHQSYVCKDRVLDMAAFITPNNAKVRLLLLIAHKGAGILENGHLVAHIAISSGPSRLATPPVAQVAEIKCFYGAADGSVGIITYEETTLSNNCLVEGRGLGSVVCLGWFYSNANLHLAVGRNDGSVQLYLIDVENLHLKPRLKFTYFSGEPVTSVVGGCVGTDEGELLVATFSGRIFALRSKFLIAGSVTKASHENLAARRSKLEIEIVRLEKQTANEREKYQRNSRSLQAGLSTPPLLDIEHKMSGATREGWQEVDITLAVPLDMLFIYCSKKLKLLTDSAAVLSVCSSQDSASDLLATVRCQAGTRRIWLRLRVASTNSTVLESTRVLIYALPTGAPRVARLLSIKLPALPYYSQHEEFDENNDHSIKSWCQLHVTGGFSVAEMTFWLSDILPGDLPRPASNVAFLRVHSLLGTKLYCQYQRGSAVFKSNNISTVSSVRSIISNCSIDKRIRVEISCDIPDDCCLKSFKLIENIISIAYEKKNQVTLAKALDLLELDTKAINAEKPVLCKEYYTVLKNSESEILQSNFDELIEIVVQWYLDWRSLSVNGNNTVDQSNKLCALLKDYKLDDVTKVLSELTEFNHTCE